MFAAHFPATRVSPFCIAAWFLGWFYSFRSFASFHSFLVSFSILRLAVFRFKFCLHSLFFSLLYMAHALLWAIVFWSQGFLSMSSRDLEISLCSLSSSFVQNGL